MTSKRFIIAGLLFAMSRFVLGCGSTEGVDATSSGTSDASGVVISGTVEAPGSTSNIVRVGLSTSKSVSKGIADNGSSDGSDSVIVSKAITESPVSGGTVTATLLDGTALARGTITHSGAISGVVIDPNQLDSTKQVLLKCESEGKKFTSLVDLTGKAVGSRADAGKVNSDTTLATQQVYYQADPDCSPDNVTNSCASKFSSGDVKPLALFKTFTGEFDVSSSADSDNAANAYQFLRRAWKAAMANGTPSFSDINSALQGGSILTTWQGFDSSISNINPNVAITHIQNYIPAVAKTFADSATFTKYQQAGDTGWAACAQYFGKQTKDDMKGCIDNPAVCRGYLSQNADAFAKGDTAAFDAMKKAGVARVMGQLSGKFSGSFSDAQFSLLKSLFDAKAASFDSVDASRFAAMGEAFFNQVKACDTAAEIALVRANPGVFAGKIFDTGGVGFTGTAGVTKFNNQFATWVQNPTAFAGATAKGCSADADCGTGLICNIGAGYCVSSTCTGNCAWGAPCTSNGICQSNACTACTTLGGCTGNGFCTGNTGISAATLVGTALKPAGYSCTTDGDCYSQKCSSGTCASFLPAGSASFAGFYKRNSSGTCITNITIDGPSGTTFISFGPDNPNDAGSSNTFMGGGITLSGTSSPFSINSATSQGAIATSKGVPVTLTCATITLSGTTLSGTCTLGGGLSGTCTINHTKL